MRDTDLASGNVWKEEELGSPGSVPGPISRSEGSEDKATRVTEKKDSNSPEPCTEMNGKLCSLWQCSLADSKDCRNRL